MLEIQIHRLPHGRDLPWPEVASEGSAGFDLRAAVAESLLLAAGKRVLVPTGLQIAIPLGWEAQVRPRSGLALNYGVIIPNSPGTIDSDYRGEVGVILANIGEGTFTLRRGDRIAQLVFARVEAVRWRQVERLPASERGKGGFGSTGMT